MIDAISEMLEFAEEQYQSGSIKSYNYDRITNTLRVELYPTLEKYEIKIHISSNKLEGK